MTDKKRYEIKPAPVMAGKDKYACGPFTATQATIMIWSDGRWVRVPNICVGECK